VADALTADPNSVKNKMLQLSAAKLAEVGSFKTKTKTHIYIIIISLVFMFIIISSIRIYFNNIYIFLIWFVLLCVHVHRGKNWKRPDRSWVLGQAPAPALQAAQVRLINQ